MQLKKLMNYAFCFFSILASVSCDKDEPAGTDPAKPVNDPAGTTIVSVRNENNGGTGFQPAGTGSVSVYIDKADNFYGSYWKFTTIGACRGLGNVVSIPASGWTERTSVREGYGYVGAYVINDDYRKVHEVTYIRMYVDEYMISTLGGVIGAEIKYQAPFNGTATSIKTDAANDLVVINQKGDEAVVKIESIPYSVSTDDSWINVSADVSSIKISAAPNDLAILRTGTVTLKSAALKAEKKLTVQQGGVEPYMLLTGSNLNKNTLDLTLVNPVTFDVNTNSAWEIKSGDSWCTATVSAPRSNYVGKYTVSVNASDNDTGKARETTLTILYGEDMKKSETITVKQDIPGFEVTPSKLRLNGEANSTGILNVITTVNWTAKSSQTWCTLSPASAKGSQKVNVVVAGNLSGNEREATVTFSYNGLDKTVKVVQSKPEFELSDQKVSMGPTETDFVKFDIKTSMSWTISASASWLTVQNPSGSKDATITVKANEKNLTGKTRSAIVSVKAADGTVKTVTVEQYTWFVTGNGSEANPYIITNADEFFSLKYATGIGQNISIENDINLSAILPDDGWKSIKEFRGVLKGNNHSISGLWGEPLVVDNYGIISGLNLLLGSGGISGAGIICSNNNGGTVEGCTVKGNITGVSNYTGGICGYNGGGVIQDCVIYGNITGLSNNYTGGICGYSNFGKIQKCKLSGKVSNGNYVGGIVGYGYGGSSFSIKECFSEGNITGSGYVAGINNVSYYNYYGYITDSYSNATVESTALSERSGKVAGISIGSTGSNCYYSGKLIGNTKFGISDVSSSYSYYNSETSGASQGGIPKILVDMKKQATYEGWDFNTIWKIDEGKSYPQLRCFDK